LGFIQKIRKVFNLSVSDPKAWSPSSWNLYGAGDVAGENVNEKTALTYSAFWCAVFLISGTIGSLPLHLMQEKGKKKRLVTESPTYRVMHDRWNPFITAKVGRQTMMSHVLTWGNGYAEKVYSSMGDLIELWPISPDRVKSIEMIENDLVYGIYVDGEVKYLPRKRILHLHGMGFDGFGGYSMVSMARKSIGLGMAMETFGSNLFSQGLNPGAVIKHEGTVKNIAEMRKALSEVYAGLGKTHRLMLLEDGMDFEKVGIPPEDSQFLESRQFQIPEIARWFNLPPHKLRDLTKASFNNIEQEQISFVTDSILPWCIDFEQEYNLQILSDRQKYNENMYFKHVLEGLLRADSKSRAEFYQIMKRNGFMTMNEVRGKEDLNPHDDLLADELWTEMNLSPLSKYEDMSNKNAPQIPNDNNPSNKKLIELIRNGGQA